MQNKARILVFNFTLEVTANKTRQEKGKKKKGTHIGKKKIKLPLLTHNCLHGKSQATYKMLPQLQVSLKRSQDTRSMYTYQSYSHIPAKNDWKLKLNQQKKYD